MEYGIIGAARSTGWKLLWALAVVLLPVLGMILYFIVGKSA